MFSFIHYMLPFFCIKLHIYFSYISGKNLHFLELTIFGVWTLRKRRKTEKFLQYKCKFMRAKIKFTLYFLNWNTQKRVHCIRVFSFLTLTFRSRFPYIFSSVWCIWNVSFFRHHKRILSRTTPPFTCFPSFLFQMWI